MTVGVFKSVAGGVTAPRGYRASGVAARIKPTSTKKDCALIVSDTVASVAGVFTTNVVKAPGVRRNARICSDKGRARAVFINSGNANTCTGIRGAHDVTTTAERVARGLKCSPDEVCVCSTGVIGVPLPMDRIFQGVDGCIESLSANGSSDAAAAIMTTDTVPKELSVEVALPSGTVRIGAIAKGSGMIAPNMATMIAVLVTDAGIAPGPLADLLRRAVAVSFNRICIDNDMSTSDTVLCLANGQAGIPQIEPGTPAFTAFEAAFTLVCQDLARLLVKDGEGATKFVEIAVDGARTDDDARTIARAIAHSHLCKTAFFGEDPNWGRLACAAGYSGAEFDPNRLSIWLENIQLMRDGENAEWAEEEAVAVMKRPGFRIRISVGDGPGSAIYWTTDLSHEYVSINADYRT